MFSKNNQHFMKKLFSFLAASLLAAGLQAAPAVVAVSPAENALMEPVMFSGAYMSVDRQFVAGMDKAGYAPAIWNRNTNEVISIMGQDTIWEIEYQYAQDTMWNDIYDENFNVIGKEIAWQYIYDDNWNIIDSTCIGDNYAVILGMDTTGFHMEDCGGAFHAVSGYGVAVGEFGPEGNGKPVMMDINGNLTYLPMPEGNVIGSAYAISDEGQTIIGFCYDAAWHTVPCIWTNGGQNVSLLPIPTDEEMGFEVEYASARYASADASVVMGYVQDNFSGNWVMVVWKKDANGNYVADGSAARTYYNSSANYNPEIAYSQFEGKALSADGNWVAIEALTNFDMTNWDDFGVAKLVRLNLTTGEIAAVEAGADDQIFCFGIANDGTVVGRKEAFDFDTFSASVEPILWKAGEAEFASVDSLMNDQLFNPELKEVFFSSISADGNYILGNMNYVDEFENFIDLTFIIQMDANTGIANIQVEKQVEGIFDLMGRKYSTLPAAAGVYIVNGQKIIK